MTCLETARGEDGRATENLSFQFSVPEQERGSWRGEAEEHTDRERGRR